MKPGLRNTLIVSIALVGVFNLIEIAADYNQNAQATFSPAWADTTAVKAPATPAANPSSTPATLLPSDGTGTAAPTTPAPAAPNPAAAPDPVAVVSAKLSASGLKPDYAGLYLAAQARTGTPWQLLAAVHYVETGQRGDTSIQSSAGAVGPMQFMPATFNAYALDGDGNGTRSITDVDDAVFTAANYLRAGGADKRQFSAALYHYNHSYTYVNRVLAVAYRLGL